VSPRVLVAGVGNLFMRDDGFGTEVTRRMATGSLPEGVRVGDFGVGSVHLVYELMDGCDLLVLVDAAPRGGQPGTLYVIEPALAAPEDGEAGGTGAGGSEQAGGALLDGHSLTPDGVLALIGGLGSRIGKVRVVGCEPASVEEGIGLTPAVEAAVDSAIGLVRGLIDEVVGPTDPGEDVTQDDRTKGARHA
jgi:hydrogenase maturation protease